MGEPKGKIVVPLGDNPSGDLRSLELDASDNLKVVMGDTSLSALLTELQQKLETADLELVASVLSTGGHGWIGGAWQRNPIRFGVSGQVKSSNSAGLGAGANRLNGTVVPAGEVQVITQVQVRYDGTSPTAIYAGFFDGADDYFAFVRQTPTSTVYYASDCWLVLVEGDRPSSFVEGATAGDTLTFRASGFRIDIDQ